MSSEPVPRRATIGLLLGTYGAILVGVGATIAPWYVNQYEIPVQARWETLGTYTLRELGPTGLANALGTSASNVLLGAAVALLVVPFVLLIGGGRRPLRWVSALVMAAAVAAIAFATFSAGAVGVIEVQRLPLDHWGWWFSTAGAVVGAVATVLVSPLSTRHRADHEQDEAARGGAAPGASEVPDEVHHLG